MSSQFNNACTVSGTLGLVIRISQVFGLAPLKVEDVRDTCQIRVSRAASTYSKFVILVISTMTVVSVAWDVFLRRSSQTLKHMEIIVYAAIVSAVTSTLLTQALCGIYRMQSIITSLNQIRKITVELSLYRTPDSNDNKTCIWTICSLISSSLILISDYGISIYRISTTHRNLYIAVLYMSRYIEYAMLKVLTNQINLLFLTALSTFRHLNDCLDDLLKQTERSSTYKINKMKCPSMVQKLSLMYCSLCEVIQNLDNSHGVMLVLMIASLILHLVVTPYNFITKLLFGNKVNYYKAVLQVPWLVYHCWDLIMLVEPCHRTQLQMYRTRHLISELLSQSVGEHQELVSELKLFYRHTMTHEALYAPLNLFQLDRSLLLTIVGSVTTYLVIVVKL